VHANNDKAFILLSANAVNAVFTAKVLDVEIKLMDFSDTVTG